MFDPTTYAVFLSWTTLVFLKDNVCETFLPQFILFTSRVRSYLCHFVIVHGIVLHGLVFRFKMLIHSKIILKCLPSQDKCWIAQVQSFPPASFLISFSFIFHIHSCLFLWQEIQCIYVPRTWQAQGVHELIRHGIHDERWEDILLEILRNNIVQFLSNTYFMMGLTLSLMSVNHLLLWRICYWFRFSALGP